MSADEAHLDRTIAEWLIAKDSRPELLPETFAAALPTDVADRFLDELATLAEIEALAEVAYAEDLPRRFGNFLLLEELGRGAEGVVYEAEHVTTGRVVALKIMHSHALRDAHALGRFRREASATASIEHPCIVSVLDAGCVDDTRWLTMERVRGTTVDRLLAAEGNRNDADHAEATALSGDPRRLARVIAATAAALDVAHRRGVVHRDLKPANLLLRRDGWLMVLDFGLASASAGDEALLTRTGDFLGTPLYMAPEQVMGAENASPRSDIYSLGAVVYELITGVPPIRRGSLGSVVDAILHGTPTPPHELDPTVPIELSRIVMQCLEKEPARRYGSAIELAEDLLRFATGEAVHARGPAPIRRPDRVALAAGLAAIGICLALASWRSVSNLDHASRPTIDAHDSLGADLEASDGHTAGDRHCSDLGVEPKGESIDAAEDDPIGAWQSRVSAHGQSAQLADRPGRELGHTHRGILDGHRGAAVVQQLLDLLDAVEGAVEQRVGALAVGGRGSPRSAPGAGELVLGRGHVVHEAAHGLETKVSESHAE